MLSIDELKQLKVGDTIFISHSGNTNRNVDHVIEKIGNKYIYLSQRTVIDLTTGKTKKDYRGMSDCVFKDEHSYHEYCQKFRFIKKVKKDVSEVNLTYEQALKIDEMLRSE